MVHETKRNNKQQNENNRASVIQSSQQKSSLNYSGSQSKLLELKQQRIELKYCENIG